MCSYVTTLTYSNSLFFFFNDTATTEIYTLSLHDALPILSRGGGRFSASPVLSRKPTSPTTRSRSRDRKSTRLNSSHLVISYAVFCLKKKKKTQHHHNHTSHIISRNNQATELVSPQYSSHC